jgi:hypothetical protein
VSPPDGTRRLCAQESRARASVERQVICERHHRKNFPRRRRVATIRECSGLAKYISDILPSTLSANIPRSWLNAKIADPAASGAFSVWWHD